MVRSGPGSSHLRITQASRREGGGRRRAWLLGWDPAAEAHCDQCDESENRQRGPETIEARRLVLVDDLIGGLRRYVRLVERRLQVLVRHERDAGGELALRLGRDALRDLRVVLDAAEERRAQGRDEHGACERGSD